MPEIPRKPDDLNDVIDANIKTLSNLHERIESTRSRHQRLADSIAGFVGSVWSVYLHVSFILIWVFVNTGIFLKIKPFDPYPFELISMLVSVEAIFLTTVVLINQKRAQLLSERRADLDLQISLFTEHELTRLIRVVDLIAKKMDIRLENRDENLDEQKKDVNAEAVLKRIDELSTKHV